MIGMNSQITRDTCSHDCSQVHMYIIYICDAWQDTVDMFS